MHPRKDLGSILLEENVVSARDLERVERERAGAGHPLWAALLAAGLTSEDELYFLLAKRGSIPLISDDKLARLTLPDAVAGGLGQAEAMSAGLLPVELSPDGQRANVAMVDPYDQEALDELRVRLGLTDVRPLLARHGALMAAISRCLQDAAVGGAPFDDDKTGTVQLGKPATVEIDPKLQQEIARLPVGARRADPLTPMPRLRTRPRPRPPEALPPSDAAATSPLEAAERLCQVLLQVTELLAGALEVRLQLPPGAAPRRRGVAVEMGRLAREVARQLGQPRRLVDEIGLAAQLYALDRLMRDAEGDDAPDLFAELGWPAGGEGGLMPTLRALTAASSGFQRAAGPLPVGAKVVGVIADYLELGVDSGEGADLGTVSQLLRASAAGPQVVDALLAVLRAQRGLSGDAPGEPDVTPAMATELPPEPSPRLDVDELEQIATRIAPEPFRPRPRPDPTPKIEPEED
jgi:hypothetical protein